MSSLKITIMTFGTEIRKIREAKGMLMRQLAAALEVDTATISKIENGLRHATKKQVHDFAEVLETDYTKLESLWMGYKIYDMLQDIGNPTDALTVAEEQVAYQKTKEK